MLEVAVDAGDVPAEGGGAGGWLVYRSGSTVDDLTANWWNFTNVDAVSVVDLQQPSEFYHC